MFRRDNPNWIAFGCAVAYILCFLFLPFYHVLLYRVSGWSFIGQNAVMAVPLILGMLMALSSVLLEAKISVGIASVTAIATFVLMLTAHNLLLPTVILQHNITSLVSQSYNLLTDSLVLHATVGAGAILSLLSAIGMLAAELLLSAPSAKRPASQTDDFDF